MTTITIFRDTSWSYGEKETCKNCSGPAFYWCRWKCRVNVCINCAGYGGCLSCHQEEVEGP